MLEKSDREAVFTAPCGQTAEPHSLLQEDALVHGYDSEALSGDHQVVQAAVQKDVGALHLAVHGSEHPYAVEKKEFYLLKLTILSGRSTVVAAYDHAMDALDILTECRSRLGLADAVTTVELWQGSDSSDRVPDDGTRVSDWPGVVPPGQISEYQQSLQRSISDQMANYWQLPTNALCKKYGGKEHYK
eukprot:5270394-Amphidinium_carterae.1